MGGVRLSSAILIPAIIRDGVSNPNGKWPMETAAFCSHLDEASRGPNPFGHWILPIGRWSQEGYHVNTTGTL
jgi:hypothetical protein